MNKIHGQCASGPTFAFLATITLFACGCTTTPVRLCTIVNRPAVIQFNTWQQTYEVVAHCPPDEQMLGGGYSFYSYSEAWRHDPIFDHAGEHGMDVIASYPSSEKTWTVKLFNHDPKPGPNQPYTGSIAGQLFWVDCFCLRGRSPDAGMHYASADDPLAGEHVNSSIVVKAPTGSVVTGGGFETVYPSEIEGPSPTLNGYILASTPTVATTGEADGWRVDRLGMPNVTVPKTKAWVCYATKNLVAGKVNVKPANSDNTGSAIWLGQPQCADDEFSSGGGFELRGGPMDYANLIGHWAFNNHGLSDFQGWRAAGIYPYAITPQNTLVVANVSAVCVKVPPPQLTVQIIRPAADDCVLADIDNPGHTVPVTFSARAFLGCHEVKPSFQWKLGLGDIGTGASFSRTLTFEVGTIKKVLLRVIVTDKDGRTAEDSRTITLGCLPIQ